MVQLRSHLANEVNLLQTNVDLISEPSNHTVIGTADLWIHRPATYPSATLPLWIFTYFYKIYYQRWNLGGKFQVPVKCVSLEKKYILGTLAWMWNVSQKEQLLADLNILGQFYKKTQILIGVIVLK